MRTQEFIIRLCVILPIAFWAVFIFMMLFGISAHFLGAKSWFYCTIYCKVGLFLFITAIGVVIYYQAKSCLRK